MVFFLSSRGYVFAWVFFSGIFGKVFGRFVRNVCVVACADVMAFDEGISIKDDSICCHDPSMFRKPSNFDVCFEVCT